MQTLPLFIPSLKTFSALSAEIFIIPMEQGNYISYATLRKAAFVANARVVNFLSDLQIEFTMTLWIAMAHW